MELAEAKQIFETLYSKVDGRSLSLEGRETHQYKSKSFVYGEVVPDSFYQIISQLNPQPGQVFYDLGSGTGKAVLLAHMLFDFSETIGIEFVDALYKSSVDVLQRYQNEIVPTIGDRDGKSKVSFIFGSFLDVDLSNADIIFMNSTCFQDDLILALDEKLTELKPGTQIITLSKTLKSPCYEVYKHQLYDFSWGQATAFFQRKV